MLKNIIIISVLSIFILAQEIPRFPDQYELNFT